MFHAVRIGVYPRASDVTATHVMSSLTHPCHGHQCALGILLSNSKVSRVFEAVVLQTLC